MNTFEEKNTKTALFLELISKLKDHRRINTGNIRHSLQEIIFLSLSAVLADVILGRLLKSLVILSWTGFVYISHISMEYLLTILSGHFLVHLTAKNSQTFLWILRKV